MRPNLRKRFYDKRRCGRGHAVPGAARWPRREDAVGQHARGADRARSPKRSPPSGTRRASASIPRRCRSPGSPTRSSMALRQTPSRSRKRSRNILAPISCAIAPTRRKDWLPRRQQHWDPVLAWARETFGARFVLSEGVMFVAQPKGAVAAVRNAIPSDPWRLGAGHLITTFTGSALIALAVAAGKLERRRGLGRRARRRRLEHEVLGPRRARLGAPRHALRRHAGGGRGAGAHWWGANS